MLRLALYRAAARGWAALIALVASGGLAAADFPEPRQLASAVDFWQRVYVEISTREGFLHDKRHLGVVYEKVRFAPAASAAAERAHVDKLRKKWRRILAELAAGGEPHNAEVRRVREQLRRELGRAPLAKDFAAARERLRFQRGLREKFRAGLIRAGAYEPYIRSLLQSRGMPEDLAFLPHVESSFQIEARSKYGAAGMWQFMPSTGRRYLTVDQVLDERLDPFRSSRAAAGLLADNFAKLGTWPLALTAYNHGAAGMQRAVKKTGTRDIGIICERYKGRYFGFASRNFYAQFLAARRVASAAERHFGPLERRRPDDIRRVTLPYYVDAAELIRRWGISGSRLRALNPAVQAAVWSGAKRLPAGYTVVLPAELNGVRLDGAALLASVPVKQRFTEQLRSRYHVVSRGETLARIAHRHGTTVKQLVRLNGLRSANRIYPGQKIELAPAPKKTKQATPAAVMLVKVTPRAKPAAKTLLIAAPRVKPTSQVGRLAVVAPRTKPDNVVRLAVTPKAKPASVALALSRGIATELMSVTVLTPRPKPGSKVVLAAVARPRPKPARAAAVASAQAPTMKSTLIASMLPGSALFEAPAIARPAWSALDMESSPFANHADGTDELPPPRDVDSKWRRVDTDHVVVDSGETLGHFADWLELPTRRLREINNLSRSKSIRVGDRLRLEFSRVSSELLLAKRLAYHDALMRAFLEDYRITGVVDHTIQQGESVWSLSQERYSVPVWLIHRYNPQAEPDRLKPGMRFLIPLVEKISRSST